jgi:riboflavin kinase / FMN adenylyltransferase
MRIARGIEDAAGFAPSVLTIGKFDGVHAGHAFLLREVCALARERNLSPSAMTFDPHPACVVAPEHAPRPLFSLAERCERIEAFGIEQLFILHFTAEVAQLSPEEFVARYVTGAMQARVVLVGENFRFGHKQAGGAATLQKLGESYGFETRIAAPVRCRGLVVSTSEIRHRIQEGEVAFAGRLLERPYSVSGEVVRGHGIGSAQTVPTLNLQTDAAVLPRNSVYITRTTDLDTGRRWNSITNVGTRPTFDNGALSIETFLLDPLEGPSPARIQIEFLRRLREERKFESAAALKKQILSDVARTKRYFERVPHGL